MWRNVESALLHLLMGKGEWSWLEHSRSSMITFLFFSGANWLRAQWNEFELCRKFLFYSLWLRKMFLLRWTWLKGELRVLGRRLIRTKRVLKVQGDLWKKKASDRWICKYVRGMKSQEKNDFWEDLFQKVFCIFVQLKNWLLQEQDSLKMYIFLLCSIVQ